MPISEALEVDAVKDIIEILTNNLENKAEVSVSSEWHRDDEQRPQITVGHLSLNKLSTRL